MKGQRLNLACELFDSMRDEFESMLNTLLMMADKHGKEGELILKLKVGVTTERKYEEGKVCAEWHEPDLSWNISRKLKENKVDYKGNTEGGYMLKFDADGKPYVQNVNDQMSIFDVKAPADKVNVYQLRQEDPEDYYGETDTEG